MRVFTVQVLTAQDCNMKITVIFLILAVVVCAMVQKSEQVPPGFGGRGLDVLGLGRRRFDEYGSGEFDEREFGRFGPGGHGPPGPYGPHGFHGLPGFHGPPGFHRPHGFHGRHGHGRGRGHGGCDCHRTSTTSSPTSTTTSIAPTDTTTELS